MHINRSVELFRVSSVTCEIGRQQSHFVIFTATDLRSAER